MKDEQLDQALRSLQAERASHGFTQRVLKRLDAPPSDAQRRVWLRVVAVAVVLLVVVPATLWWRDRVERDVTRNEILALRDEYRQLEQQLEVLRRVRAESEPVVGVGSDDQVDYVVPLETLLNNQTRNVGLSGPQAESIPARYMGGPL
jgi:hypothetical protein